MYVSFSPIRLSDGRKIITFVGWNKTEAKNNTGKVYTICML